MFITKGKNAFILKWPSLVAKKRKIMFNYVSKSLVGLPPGHLVPVGSRVDLSIEIGAKFPQGESGITTGSIGRLISPNFFYFW